MRSTPHRKSRHRPSGLSASQPHMQLPTPLPPLPQTLINLRDKQITFDLRHIVTTNSNQLLVNTSDLLTTVSLESGIARQLIDKSSWNIYRGYIWTQCIKHAQIHPYDAGCNSSSTPSKLGGVSAAIKRKPFNQIWYKLIRRILISSSRFYITPNAVITPPLH